MAPHQIQFVAFQDVLPLWQSELWPRRTDPIRAMSSMLREGGHDLAIYQLYAPTFLAWIEDGRVIGVNSGHRTSNTDYRSRGLYVHSEFRRHGIAHALLQATAAQARHEGAEVLWSYPRHSAWNVYKSNGFIGEDRRLHSTDENFYAVKSLIVATNASILSHGTR